MSFDGASGAFLSQLRGQKGLEAKVLKRNCLPGWIASLEKSRRELNRFLRLLRKA